MDIGICFMNHIIFITVPFWFVHGLVLLGEEDSLQRYTLKHSKAITVRGNFRLSSVFSREESCFFVFPQNYRYGRGFLTGFKFLQNQNK